MLEKSIQLESELGDLQKIYDQKRKSYTNVGWMESNEIDQLFEDAQTKKLRMKQQLAELQALLKTAKRAWPSTRRTVCRTTCSCTNWKKWSTSSTMPPAWKTGTPFCGSAPRTRPTARCWAWTRRTVCRTMCSRTNYRR